MKKAVKEIQKRGPKEKNPLDKKVCVRIWVKKKYEPLAKADAEFIESKYIY